MNRCRIAAFALAFASLAPASSPGQSAPRQSRGNDSSAVLDIQRRWWSSLTTRDTAYLAAHSSPRLTVTLSSGRTHDRASLARSITEVPPHDVATRWAEESVQLLTSSVAVAHAQAIEGEGPRSSVYRYVTVLEQDGGTWTVRVAQSTREPMFAPQVGSTIAGALGDFAGSYRTPRGLSLRVAVSDSLLVMTEPSGLALNYRPIGPGLFESDRVSPDGAITRLNFPRDAAGRVAAMSVLSPGMVISFPRVP